MSRYSFIDDSINISGKQCFCIDANSTISPFVINDNNVRPQSPRPQSPRPQSPPSSPRPQSPPSSPRPGSPQIVAPGPTPLNATKPISSDLHAIIKHEGSKLSKNKDYLITPDVINSKTREQKIIDTANSLLTRAYKAVSSKYDPIASNATKVDLPKNSLTVDTDRKLVSQIDLNAMANDNKVGKKTLRKNSSNLSLFENFQSGECSDTCKIKSKNRRDKRPRQNRRKMSSYRSNENFYLLVIIILLLAISWFKK